jgi:NRAMP (natural resistance-associated macrophage protein)-like metal ion transporter
MIRAARGLVRRGRSLLHKLGPGLITGAADDDPSGIATYSQGGAQFGYATLWTVFATTPLMIAIQLVSARIGLVTGRGIGANLRAHFPVSITIALVGLLCFANAINIAADLAAMGQSLQLLVGGPRHLYALLFGALSATAQVFMSFPRYVRTLKWLTLSLFAYVGIVFVVHIDWKVVAWNAVVPSLMMRRDYLTTVVAILGTTISPYLFFWQAAQEVEEQRGSPTRNSLAENPGQARVQLRRVRIDTVIGMVFSNAIAFFIILTAAVTLHARGVTSIETSAQAAQALRPIAGNLAFTLFALGIIGTGLLAVPVLAGSAAYAVAETFDWRTGLDQKLPGAREFYGIIVIAIIGGAVLEFAPLDPVKMLYWSAVVNGVVAVPIMIAMLILAGRRSIMGDFVMGRRLRSVAWLAAAVMLATVAGMFLGPAG